MVDLINLDKFQLAKLKDNTICYNLIRYDVLDNILICSQISGGIESSIPDVFTAAVFKGKMIRKLLFFFNEKQLTKIIKSKTIEFILIAGLLADVFDFLLDISDDIRILYPLKVVFVVYFYNSNHLLS